MRIVARARRPASYQSKGSSTREIGQGTSAKPASPDTNHTWKGPKQRVRTIRVSGTNPSRRVIHIRAKSCRFVASGMIAPLCRALVGSWGKRGEQLQRATLSLHLALRAASARIGGFRCILPPGSAHPRPRSRLNPNLG